MPKFFYGALTAVIAAAATVFAAAIAGNRIAAAWDLRKKRGELDLLLTTDFYKQVATFKAIAREWTNLAARKPLATGATFAAWEEQQQALVLRAIVGEADMEVILLKLVVDLPSGTTEEHASDLHRLALLRIIYRNLRERIGSGVVEPPPGYRDPALWMFNSLVGHVAEIIQARTARPLHLRDKDVVDRPRVDYLRLITYRTADYQIALNNLAPRVRAFFDLRDNDRVRQRQDNIKKSFIGASFAYAYELLPPPSSPSAPPSGSVKVVVEMPRTGLDLRDAHSMRVAAERLFQRSPHLQYYLLIADGDARIILFTRGAANPIEFRETDVLPNDLPFAIAQPVYGIALLRWEVSHETLVAIADIDVRDAPRDRRA
ncbi:hypothetical protein [Paraburkholderia sediminicola]|uniref:hypothetical protein n=1 Tax=Paraburkholderia sediminicola TaxID=458836 RepID=UPI0038BCD7D6